MAKTIARSMLAEFSVAAAVILIFATGWVESGQYDYFRVKIDGSREALHASDTLFIVQFREGSTGQARESALLELEKAGFNYSPTTLVSGVAPSRTGEFCALLWSSEVSKPQRLNSALAAAKRSVQSHRQAIAGLMPYVFRANGRPSFLSPGCLLVRLNNEVPLQEYWEIVGKHGFVPYDSSSPVCIRERYLQNTLRVASNGDASNVFEFLSRLERQEGISGVYPVLLRELHQPVNFPRTSSGQSIREFLASRGYERIQDDFAEVLYVAERHGMSAAERFCIDSRRSGSDTVHVEVFLDGFHSEVPQELLETGLHAASDLWHDSVEVRLNSREFQSRTHVFGWIPLRSIPSLFHVAGVIRVQGVLHFRVTDTTVQR